MQGMAHDLIYTDEDVLAMLDSLLSDKERSWWNGFYADRAKPCPFFVDSPDENLSEWTLSDLVRPGKAMDLGCGNARNALFLARQGFAVEGVDYSETAINWAKERVAAATGTAPELTLRCQSVFDLNPGAESYDLVYDSGCFHHIAPHRRRAYVELVTNALKPGGWFGLTCFRPEGGSGLSDQAVYEHRTMGGGLGYSEEGLRHIWSRSLRIHVLRQMRKPAKDAGLFGEDFLWVMLAQKSPPATA
jgi:SAM-dependent methyltransferase